MATYTIPIQMDIVGTGDTEEAAQSVAAAQYVNVISSLCEEYGFEGTLLEGGLPTPEAVAFARNQVRRYLSEVVNGWKRRKAVEAAAASVPTTELSME